MYSRPDITKGETGLSNYETCKGYAGLNTQYAMVSYQSRQSRLHTCFSYCIDGEDDNIIGEKRPNCIDLPP